MSVPNYIRPGSKIGAYPAATHNWMLSRIKDLLSSRGNLDAPPGEIDSRIRIKNSSGSLIQRSFGILEIEGPLNDPGDHAGEPYQKIRISGVAPSGGRRFAVLQKSASVNGFVPCVVSGLTWVRVDIKNEADVSCGSIDGDTGKLESGKGSVPIVWKEGGTGEKWAIIMLGGTAQPSIIYGTATTAVTSGTATFSIDNIFVASGPDPRSTPGDMSESLPVLNTFMLTLSSGDLVRGDKRSDGEWDTIRPGEGGPAGDAGVSTSVFSFRLAADMAPADNFANARLIDQNGNDLTPATPAETVADETARLAMVVGSAAGQVEADDIIKQDDTDTLWRYDGGGTSNAANWTNLGPASLDIVVIDKRVNSGGDFGLAGLVDYVDCFGEDQTAFLGECRNVGIANYSGTGRPAYEIVSMEGLAESLLVKFKEQPSGSSQPISVEVLEVFGSNYCHRPPESVGGTPPDVIFNVFDPNQLADNGEIDDIWHAELKQGDGTYRLVAQSPGLRSYEDYGKQKTGQSITHENGVLKWIESGLAFVILSSDVGAASGSLGSFTAGLGTAKLAVKSGLTYTAIEDDIDVHNFSMTAIRASESSPVFLSGVIFDGAFIPNQIMDLSGLPGFDLGAAPTGTDDPDLQIPFHPGGSAEFQLDSEDCGA